MNSYRALVEKLEAIQNRVEEGAQMAPPSVPEMPVQTPHLAVSECGDEAPMIVGGMPSGMMGMRDQDSVTMNVTMNGTGANGIRDLMSVLRDIENGTDEPAHGDTDDMIVGVEEPEMDEEIDGGFQSATTSPDQEVSDVNAVTRTGNDLASKGDEAPKVNGGGNPFKEGLMSQLADLYKEVKLR